jgi:hypothetical protein
MENPTMDGAGRSEVSRAVAALPCNPDGCREASDQGITISNQSSVLTGASVIVWFCSPVLLLLVLRVWE